MGHRRRHAERSRVCSHHRQPQGHTHGVGVHVASFFNEDTNVVLDFLQGLAGTPPTAAPGTATDGTISIVLHYTRSAPTPGV